MNAAKITRESKSNLAFAFVSLGRERREDITIFYAFCRVIDDIADSTELTVQEKARDLTAWRRWLRESSPDEPAIAQDARITPAARGSSSGTPEIALTTTTIPKSKTIGVM